jgi:hypothetical protein
MECNKAIIDSKKTFCVCQYDDGPLVDLGETRQFLASRKTNYGFDVPLLCKQHKKPFFKKNKVFLASFIGRFNTHEIRLRIFELLKNKKNILIVDRSSGVKFFVNNTLKSFVSLCPRGYGGSSFRFFEAMQLGVVPFLIGDIDTRPFKDFIDWNKVSFYTDDVNKIESILKSVSEDNFLIMGKRAKNLYENDIGYGNWCKYLLKELEK